MGIPCVAEKDVISGIKKRTLCREEDSELYKEVEREGELSDATCYIVSTVLI